LAWWKAGGEIKTPSGPNCGERPPAANGFCAARDSILFFAGVCEHPVINKE
jgi:hypothetical protein